MIKSPCFDILKEEMINVLLCMKIDFKVTDSLMNNHNRMSREEFVDNLILSRALSNDIDIRLNKFVDKRTDTCSLFTVIKELKKAKRAKLTPTLEEIEKRLNLFIKTEFKEIQAKRNDKLAHLKKGRKFSWDEVSVIINAVTAIVKIMDELETKKINYHYSYGKMEREINLRKHIGL
jgi:hypothetical protein